MAAWEKNLNKVRSNKIINNFDQIDQWGQRDQLIIYETKNGNLEGLCMA